MTFGFVGHCRKGWLSQQFLEWDLFVRKFHLNSMKENIIELRSKVQKSEEDQANFGISPQVGTSVTEDALRENVFGTLSKKEDKTKEKAAKVEHGGKCLKAYD